MTKIWKKKKKPVWEDSSPQSGVWLCFFLTHQAKRQGVEVGSLPPGCPSLTMAEAQNGGEHLFVDGVAWLDPAGGWLCSVPSS